MAHTPAVALAVVAGLVATGPVGQPASASSHAVRAAGTGSWTVEAAMRRPDGSLVNAEDGMSAGELSGDGRFMLVESTEPGLVAGLDVSPAGRWYLPYVVDRWTGKVTMPLVDAMGKVFPWGVGDRVLNMYPSLSADGRWLVIGRPLVSMLPSWVAQQTNPEFFARQFISLVDLSTGVITAIRTPSVRVGSVTGRTKVSGLIPISRDGRYLDALLFGVRPVGAQSGVENYVGGFRYDRITGTWLEIVRTNDPNVRAASILSPDGQWASILQGSTIRMQHLASGRRWPIPADQTLAQEPFSGDSTKVITQTTGASPREYTVREVATGRVLGRSHFSKDLIVADVDASADTFLGEVSEPNGLSRGTDPYPTQSYVCGWASGECTRISQGLDGGPAWGGRIAAGTISDDGRVATFVSNAPNLARGDRKPYFAQDNWDVFTATLTDSPS